MIELQNLDINVNSFSESSLINLLLFGSQSFSNDINSKILNLNINFYQRLKKV